MTWKEKAATTPNPVNKSVREHHKTQAVPQDHGGQEQQVPGRRGVRNQPDKGAHHVRGSDMSRGNTTELVKMREAKPTKEKVTEISDPAKGDPSRIEDNKGQATTCAAVLEEKSA